MLKIGIRKRNKEISESWNELNKKYGSPFVDGEAYRLWVKNKVTKYSGENIKSVNGSKKFEETVEISGNGTQRSSKIITMSEENNKSTEFILRAHGYDPEEWELINAKHSIWTGYSKKDGQFPQYASKITVKPKTVLFSIDKLVNLIKENTVGEGIHPSKRDLYDKRMLEIPIFDAHFGVSSYEYYKETQIKIYKYINSRHWDKIVFAIGSDNFHNDDFRGRTSKGTEIEKVDMVQAWKDALNFYVPLIESAVNNSNNVKIIYIKGNHDEAMSWAFVQHLKAKFPKLEFNDEFEERKAILYGKNFIGFTHGDKAKKNLHHIFPVEFSEMWAKANNREIHIGHLHREDAMDSFGTVIRTLSTRNKTDQWSKDYGFVGAHKRFMLFEYSLENLESIHYV